MAMAKKLNLTFFTNLPAHERKITVSTVLTFARIVLTPVIVISMIMGYWGTAFLLFCIASTTDVLDGLLARWLNEQTFLGAALDPIADKLLLVSCFTTLAFVQSPLFSIPLWFVLFVLIKELIILLGAVIIYVSSGDLEIKPTWLGKVTTLIQVCFIIWLFACYFFAWVPLKTYYTMLGIMIVVIAASLVQYIAIGWQQLMGSKGLS
ncbi:MAG TPA: CDP-alcohol phosphatidyltransferase family protein [Candidatus Babeliales bacterium]|nr:CDP-alcohol phosphatidyltransferase family protein [Candidatus Babeliales bacterium]